MTVADLEGIHSRMTSEIEETGGKISKIYYAPDLADDAINRKPNPGMALQAKHDFLHIDFSKSIIVGNRISDMGFGRNAGIHTVFVATTHPETPFPDPLIDLRFNSLYEFAAACASLRKP